MANEKDIPVWSMGCKLALFGGIAIFAGVNAAAAQSAGDLNAAQLDKIQSPASLSGARETTIEIEAGKISAAPTDLPAEEDGPDIPFRYHKPDGFGFLSVCGSQFDYVDVEDYPSEYTSNPYFEEKFYKKDPQTGSQIAVVNPFDGDYVDRHRPATVLIRLADESVIDQVLADAGWTDGVISKPTAGIKDPLKRQFCTGTLIDGNRVLTAGHCIAMEAAPTRTKNGVEERATMQMFAQMIEIVFDYRVSATTNFPAYGLAHAVTRLVDHSDQWIGKKTPILDYAVLDICDAPTDVARNGDACNPLPPATEDDPYDADDRRRISGSGRQPKVVHTSDPAKDDKIAIIQHPGGIPKKVDVGAVSDLQKDIARYQNIDTRKGSSGSGVLDEQGRIVAVHVSGGCSTDTATGDGNGAVMIEAIRDHASSL